MVIGALKCIHPEKYTDNSKYDVLTGNMYSIYIARLAEGLLDKADTVLETTTKERHSKLYAKTLAQMLRIGLGSAQQNLKTTTQVIIGHAVHPLTHRYMTDIIHG